jgi:hypothetical protein
LWGYTAVSVFIAASDTANSNKSYQRFTAICSESEAHPLYTSRSARYHDGMKSHEIRALKSKKTSPSPVTQIIVVSPSETADVSKACPVAYRFKALYEANTESEIKRLLSEFDESVLKQHAENCVSCRKSIENFNKIVKSKGKKDAVKGVMASVTTLLGIHWLKKLF